MFFNNDNVAAQSCGKRPALDSAEKTCSERDTLVDLLRKSALGLLDLDQYPKPLYNPSPGHTSALRSIRQRIVQQGDSHCEVQPCECVGASHMSKPERLGPVVLTVGGALGLVLGSGPMGLVFAAVCLVVGLVLVVTSTARGTMAEPGDAQTPHPAHKKAQVLVLVKDVHARPQRGGGYREIRDPNETDLEFEVFIHCWLLNETDLPLQIVEELQLTLKTSDG